MPVTGIVSVVEIVLHGLHGFLLAVKRAKIHAFTGGEKPFPSYIVKAVASEPGAFVFPFTFFHTILL